MPTFTKVFVGINPCMHWVAVHAIKVFPKHISLEFQVSIIIEICLRYNCYDWSPTQIDCAFSTELSNLQLCLRFVAFLNAFSQDKARYDSIMVKHLRGESNGGKVAIIERESTHFQFSLLMFNMCKDTFIAFSYNRNCCWCTINFFRFLNLSPSLL